MNPCFSKFGPLEVEHGDMFNSFGEAAFVVVALLDAILFVLDCHCSVYI